MPITSALLDTVPHVTSDAGRWRRRVGLTDERVFICNEDGFYKDLRDALFRRGWRQAAWGSTPHWSLAISLKPTEVDFTALRPGQAVNSFEGSSALCNKSLLIASLAANAAALPVPTTAFFPRAFDLDEPHDYAAFVDDFRATAAEGVLRAVALAALRASDGGSDESRAVSLFLRAFDAVASSGSALALKSFLSAPSVRAAASQLPVNVGVVAAAVRVTSRRAPNFDDDSVLDCALAADDPPLISAREWQIIRWCSAFAAGGPMEQAPVTRAREAADRAGAPQTARSSLGHSTALLAQLSGWRDRAMRDAATPGAAAALRSSFDPNVGVIEPTALGDDDDIFALAPASGDVWTAVVDALSSVSACPSAQSTLLAERAHNVWIVKPSGKSRGRGIECDTSLDRILARRGAEAGATKATGGGGFIVQKYIERPLCVHDRKFDIRQWSLVTSWAPLEVWVFTRPYLRFCAVPYELTNVGDRFAHLSNNSIQKHSAAFGSVGDGNMWHAVDFARWLEERDAVGAWAGLEFSAGARCARPGDASAAGGGGVAPTAPVSGCGDIWGLVVEPRIHDVVLHTLLCGQDSLGARATPNAGWEQYGFDVMVDASLRVWLIEVNSAPDMSHSTSVTAALVPDATEGIAAVTCEWAAWAASGRRGPEPSTGAWRKIYTAPSAAAASVTTCTARGLAVTGTSLAPTQRGRAAAAAAAGAVVVRPAGAARSASPRPPTAGAAAGPSASKFAVATSRAGSTSVPPISRDVPPRPPARTTAGGGARAARALVSSMTPLSMGRAVIEFPL